MKGQIRDRSRDAGLWGAILLHVWWFVLPVGMALYQAGGGGNQKRPKRTRPTTPRQLQKEQDIQATEREIDALVAEFHRRLPRELCEKVGAIYARYSTKYQDSIADQVRTLLEFAFTHKIYIPRELIFADYAVRGCKENRPGFNQLKQAVEAKRFNTLLVFSTNRFYRKNYKSVRFVEEEIVERGLRCIFVTQHIDTADSKQWRMTLQVHGIMDENNATCYADNIRAAHKGLSRERIVVGTITYGYAGEPILGRVTKQKKPKQLVIVDPTASKYVIQIYDWFVIALLSIDEISRRLNDDPLAPPPPKSLDKKWSHDAVKGVLSNVRYRGFLPYGESEVRWQSKADYARQFRREAPLQIEYFDELRLVSDDIWFRAQARLQDLVTNRGRKSNRQIDEVISRILNGLFVCQVHGFQLYAGGANGGILYCKKCRALPAKTRPLFTLLNRKLALRLFAERIRDILSADETLVDRIIQACQQAAAEIQKPDEGRLQSLKAQDAELARSIDFAIRYPGETDVEQADTARRVSQLRGERAGVQADIGILLACDATPPRIPTADEVREELSRLGDILSAACQKPGGEEEGLARELVRLLTEHSQLSTYTGFGLARWIWSDAGRADLIAPFWAGPHL